MSWGPWVRHDGSGCPCVGQWVEVVYRDGVHRQGWAGVDTYDSWFWGHVNRMGSWTIAADGTWAMPVIRYRIRRPRALDICRRIAALTDQDAREAAQ